MAADPTFLIWQVLRGEIGRCRYWVCNKYPSGKKRDTLLVASKLEAPR